MSIHLLNLFAILGFFGLIVIAIVAVFILLLRNGSGSRNNSAEEARLIQEMHQQAKTLEQRIEALETILIEKENDIAKRS